MENLGILQLLTPGVRLRGSDEKLQQLKALALKHRRTLKNHLNVSVSEKLTPVAFPLRVAVRVSVSEREGIAQKLLGKIGLRLKYVARLGKRENRGCVYEFVPPVDERDLIFERWLNRDEAAHQDAISDSVSVTSNKDI